MDSMNFMMNTRDITLKKQIDHRVVALVAIMHEWVMRGFFSN